MTRNLARLRPLLGKQLCVDVAPRELFGSQACQLTGALDRILFVVSHDSPEVTIRPIDSGEVAARMVSSLQFEQANFMSYYRKFRFAFPELKNELVESSAELQGEMLKRAIDGKVAHEVGHPYPVAIPALFEAIRDRCLEV